MVTMKQACQDGEFKILSLFFLNVYPSLSHDPYQEVRLCAIATLSSLKGPGESIYQPRMRASVWRRGKGSPAPITTTNGEYPQVLALNNSVHGW